MTVQLPATGERFLPDLMPGEIALEHQHRYYAVAPLAARRDVLDVASGEGYGAALLAGNARSVIGVDIDPDAVDFATRRYGPTVPNLRFSAGSCVALPLADASVDLVVSFETIEHHDQHEAMLAEIKRVLRPGGVLVISSPDRHEYSDVPGYSNPFHVKELYREEFEGLLAQWFRSHELYGQRVRHASTLFALGVHAERLQVVGNYLADADEGSVKRDPGAIAPRYFVAVASDAESLPALAVGTFADRNEEQRLEQLALDLQSCQGIVDATREQLVGAQSQNQAAVAENDRLRSEMAEWQKHARGLEVRSGAQEAALRQLGEQHASQLKDAHEVGLKHAEQARIALEEQLRAVRDEVAQRDAKLIDLQGQVTDRDIELTSVRDELARWNEQRAALKDELTEREAQLQGILRSFSWRLSYRLSRIGRRVAGRLAIPARRASATVATAKNQQAPTALADFDEAYYLHRYPDIATAGIDPYEHFVLFGRAEGRSGCSPKLLLRETGARTSVSQVQRAAELADTADQRAVQGGETKRGTVLVVSHEATRTGAPILAWNICRELHPHYHVVGLLLGKGPLVDAFDEVCDAVVGPYSAADRDAVGLAPLIGELCERYTFDFAIVNSIASRAVLEPLARRYVPATLLVHEFFKFHCSPDELVETFAWAGQVVFSANIVRNSADIERTHPAVLRSHVLPQGKSQIPLDGNKAQKSDKVAGADSEARIEALQKTILRGRTRKPFIVLGAGTIEYRKGVDVFVATASEIKRLAPDADILMVWVGGVVEGYKQYAEFVFTQVEQLELDDLVEFIGETPDLEALYRFVDVCFISSRLDPLPNIALDALTAGLPVLSFDRATGVAENFMGDPELEKCVVPFLNVGEAAQRIIDLYRAPDERRLLSQRMVQLADERFKMSSYVEKLVDLSQHGRHVAEQEQRDVDMLMGGEDFAEWFFLPPDSKTSRSEAIRAFVKASQGGIFVRKPTPGFYPHTYVVEHDLGASQINPLVHFSAAGRPSGAWQEQLIDVTKDRLNHADRLRVAVHIHAFYPELLADIVRRLGTNELKADLFVSVPSQAIGDDCRSILANYGFGSQTIRLFPNRGRDIGPFVTGFSAELQEYDVIGHFHTKKSVHVDASSNLVRNWVHHLMENLLGGEHRSAERIVSAFADEPQLGLVFADDPHQIGWDKNLPFAKPLAERLGLTDLPEQFFSFPVGTMFWARAASLRPLFEVGLDWEDYPPEPLSIDGSMLHALERLLPSIVQHAGFERKVTYAPRITR